MPIILNFHTHRFTLHHIDILINSHSYYSLVIITSSYKRAERQVIQLVLSLSWPHVISQHNILIKRIRGRMINWAINTSVHIELISPITCEYIILFKMCEPQNGFPDAPYWYDVPVIAQSNFKHYRQFKNIIKQY